MWQTFALASLATWRHAGRVTYERLWPRLLESLNEWSIATEIAPGRIQVVVATPDDPARHVEILMSAHEWDQMVCIPWGDFSRAAEEVRKSVLAVGAHERFLIYENYELVPSESSALPVDPDEERMAELARLHPEGFGHWVALDPDGNVVDELRSSLE